MVPAKIFKSFNAVILKMEDLKVGADSIDVLDLLQLLLVQRDLFQRVEGPIVVFSSAHQKLVRYANHLEQWDGGGGVRGEWVNLVKNFEVVE